jgi:uncharacterized protein
MMLLGMALFKTGIITAEKSRSFYIKMAALCLTFGIVISGLGVLDNFNAGWSLEFSIFFGSIYNYIGSLFTAMGYLALVMLLAKGAAFKGLKIAISNVGRMAFTNYILMSLVCMFVFFGNGFGLYGHVSRVGQMGVTLGVWALLFLFSALWLRKFEMGPLEYLWRRLTYFRADKASKKTEYSSIAA